MDGDTMPSAMQPPNNSGNEVCVTMLLLIFATPTVSGVADTDLFVCLSPSRTAAQHKHRETSTPTRTHLLALLRARRQRPRDRRTTD
jgi:hypothetical protein